MSAQRVSAPVRFARLAAALLLVALAAVVVVRLAGRRGGSAPAPPAAEPPPEGLIVDLKERVHHQEYKDGRPVADIRGASFFRGPDGRNHLSGSVEIVNLGPDGETVSRLSADEVVYDPGSLRFTVAGHVRVEAAGVLLEGDSFDYDKAAGLFGTTKGGRFSSKTISGHAPEIAYRQSDDEVRLSGGCLIVFAAEERGDGILSLSGESFVYARRDRRGRVEGKAELRGRGFRGQAAAVSFVAAGDESVLESAVLAGAAKAGFDGGAAGVRRSGEIGAERIEVAFAREPFAVRSIETAGRAVLSTRSPSGGKESILAPTADLKFGPDGELLSWSASGGIRADLADAGGLSRTLEGGSAEFDGPAGALRVRGGSGRAAVADSPEARVEAPTISVVSGTGDLEASGGVLCLFKRGEGRRAVGFFSSREDVVVTGDKLVLRTGASSASFSGDVLARQGTDSLRAGELELSRERGEMLCRGGVAAGLTEAPSGGAAGRTIEIGGRDAIYRSDARTLTLTTKAYVRLPQASLEAGTVSAVLGREGKAVESLSAATAVAVSSGRYVGRSESAFYQAATGRIMLTGRPVLTDDKGGSARGAKLTFDLPDDKILIENEGPGRATTVVRS
jgi:lipopolysaccharide export system protein LptA